VIHHQRERQKVPQLGRSGWWCQLRDVAKRKLGNSSILIVPKEITSFGTGAECGCSTYRVGAAEVGGRRRWRISWNGIGGVPDEEGDA
jgi:hypothetical protein